MRAVILAAIFVCASLLPAQEAPKPKPADEQSAGPRPSFEVADIRVVHPRGQDAIRFGRFNGVHGDRYEVDTASMFDLIRTAYNFQNDKIYGGPIWLEMTRYSIAAKVPEKTDAATARLMLQSLLEQRFALKTHKEDKPLPTFAITAGKSPKLKDGDNSGEAGCKPLSAASNQTGVGSIRFGFSDGNGSTTIITTGADGLVTYTCRNVSMASFATALRGLIGANLGSNPLLDETGLKGVWSFDLSFNVGFLGMPGSDQGRRISLHDAVEKQLGLKLEKREVPTPVLVVDSVNESPTPNPAGLAEALPPLKLPTEFEVASVKVAEPFTPGAPRRPIRMNMAAGGRFTYDNVPMMLLIQRAFNVTNLEQLQGMPSVNPNDRYDIMGRVNVPPSVNPNDPELAAGLLRNLMVERFNLKYHKEQRPVAIYQLAAGKPKLKKADPANRAHCGRSNGPAGSPPGTQQLICQNVTLQQFADQLQNMSPDLVWPIDDATGVPGNFDITLTFNFNATYNTTGLARAAASRGGDGAAAVPDASDPTGGYTLAEAIEKELGLKLEKIKRNEEVYVIDHLDSKPTDN